MKVREWPPLLTLVRLCPRSPQSHRLAPHGRPQPLYLQPQPSVFFLKFLLYLCTATHRRISMVAVGSVTRAEPGCDRAGPDTKARHTTQLVGEARVASLQPVRLARARTGDTWAGCSGASEALFRRPKPFRRRRRPTPHKGVEVVLEKEMGGRVLKRMRARVRYNTTYSSTCKHLHINVHIQHVIGWARCSFLFQNRYYITTLSLSIIQNRQIHKTPFTH